MKRSSFLKGSGLMAATLASGGLFSMLSPANATAVAAKNSKNFWSDKRKFTYLGNKDLSLINRDRLYKCEVAVIGGGLAGISAAVAAARQGKQTILIQNRSVLGGNASSEVHVPINGSFHFKNKFKTDRETGIVEEIELDNLYYNEQMSWEVWDHVMYGYVTREPNLTLMLDTHAVRAEMKGNKIQRAVCFQQNTESRVTIEAQIFIDCSGDGQLAASAGADFRYGREGKDEFGEKYAPDKPDGWVMGDSIQFSSKDMGRPIKFVAPDFAVKYDPSKMNKRNISHLSCGFWWVEFSSELDVVYESPETRHKLLAYLYGAWDYVKNSGKFPHAENLALDWIGSVIGRRESRRFMGDYILKETDLTEYVHFDDTIASAGGWSLDEHCPGGLENPDDPASFFHQNFTKFTEIPYRSIYSRNIDNLMFAGRNYSCTHIALSGTRLIAMLANMGQAAGTAAAMCVNYNTNPRGIYKSHINELQEQLLRDDVFLPNRPAADANDLARKATLKGSSTKSGDVKLLVDGTSRDEVDKIHHWESAGLNSNLTLTWKEAVSISEVEFKGDSSLHRQIQLHPKLETLAERPTGMPVELIKKADVEVLVNGSWKRVGEVDGNRRRLVKFKFDSVKTTSVRINLRDTYGAPNVKLFEVRCY